MKSGVETIGRIYGLSTASPCEFEVFLVGEYCHFFVGICSNILKIKDFIIKIDLARRGVHSIPMKMLEQIRP